MKATVKRSGEVLLACCFVLAFGAAARAQQPTTTQPPRDIKPAAAPQTAAEALSRYEQALRATDDPERKFYLLSKVAATAADAGETKKAKAYARELLERAPSMRENWDYGNAIHVGNLVPGRIALAAGDVAEAKRLLLAAGDTPGSPQLNSFGPNMLLAKELLEKGEREAVVQYLDAVGKFWASKMGRVDAWKAAAAKGEMPDFGPNLNYYLFNWRYEKWDKLPSK
jgi:hypothetical protein